MWDTAGDRRKDSLALFAYGTPLHGHASVGRENELTYNTSIRTSDLQEVIDDKEEWEEWVREISTGSATSWWWWRVIKYASLFTSEKPARFSLFLFDEWCKQNLLYTSLLSRAFISQLMIRTLCLWICRGNRVSLTETNINTRLAKTWISNDRLSVIWKSDLTDKKKMEFSPSSGRVNIAIYMHYMDAN